MAWSLKGQVGLVVSTGAVIGWFAACGGKAVIDADGTGGAGGQAATTTTSGPGTTTVSTTTTTGAGGSLCGAACGTLTECGNLDDDSCVTGCEAIGACGDAHQRWLSCALGEANTMCGAVPGSVCRPDLEEYLDCTQRVIGDVACVGNNTSCTCEVFVSPGFTISQSCEMGDCQCFVGDSLIGRCDEPSQSCDALFGCCAGLFFTSF